MLLAVLRLGFVLVTILVVDVYSSCLFPKTCPCGTSGKNYTRCYNSIIEQYSCERWANCQTCDNNYELCVNCPPGRSGPTCKDGSCPLLKRPTNGQIKCLYENSSFRSCTARCFPGYHFDNGKMDEEITLNCEHNAWIPYQNIPDCKFKTGGRDCTLRGTGNHSYNCTIGMHGTYCDIKCDAKRHGRYYCYPGRGWNSTLPSCVFSREQYLLQEKKEKITCPEPGTEEEVGRMDLKGNSIPSQHIFREGDSVLFFCKRKNALFEGVTYLTCKPDGTWAGILPKCTPSPIEVKVQSKSSCKHPGVVENGIIEDFESDTEQFAVGTELRFLCREGYQIQGPEAIYCLLNLSWSESPPVCNSPPTTALPLTSQLSCKHPGTVENGFIVDDVPEIQSFPIRSELRFQCNEGHELVGANVIYCLHSVNQHGYWSDVPPYCRYVAPTTKKASEITCKPPGTIENGVIESNPYRVPVYRPGSEIAFKCREGHTMDGPDTLRCQDTGEWSSATPTCRPKRKAPDCGKVFQDVYKQTGKYSRSDWPWTVGISTVGEDDAGQMFCAGALLNSRTVLTAAHCATSSRNINLHFGHSRLAVTGTYLPEQTRTIQISRVIIHPEYDDETHANDIALMKFEPHVYYDRRTRTVCLPTPTLESSGGNLYPGTKAIVTGYGLHFASNYSSAAKFTMLEFPVEDERKCEEVCRGQGLVACNPSTFCAGSPRNADECVYGGSPLVVFHPEKNRYTLEGLVTRAESARNRWNSRCKRPESYTVFTNVTHFIPFILNHLNSMSE